MRITRENRDALARIAAGEHGGVSEDEALRIVLFEHASRAALSPVGLRLKGARLVPAGQQTAPPKLVDHIRPPGGFRAGRLRRHPGRLETDECDAVKFVLCQMIDTRRESHNWLTRERPSCYSPANDQRGGASRRS